MANPGSTSSVSRTRTRVLSVTGIVVGLVILFSVLSSFMSRGELTQAVTSPDGRWVIRVYDVSSELVRATASLQGGPSREILKTDNWERVEFEGESDNQLQIEWLGPDKARVGGYEIDLSRDHVRDY